MLLRSIPNLTRISSHFLKIPFDIPPDGVPPTRIGKIQIRILLVPPVRFPIISRLVVEFPGDCPHRFPRFELLLNFLLRFRHFAFALTFRQHFVVLLAEFPVDVLRRFLQFALNEIFIRRSLRIATLPPRWIQLECNLEIPKHRVHVRAFGFVPVPSHLPGNARARTNFSHVLIRTDADRACVRGHFVIPRESCDVGIDVGRLSGYSI